MNLHPSNADMQAQLPMHHASKNYIAGNAHYTLTEKAVGQLIVRIPETHLKTTAKAITSVTKLALPNTLEAKSNKDFSLFWLSPDEYLLIVPEKTEADIEAQLRQAMQGHFAIVDVTGGQTLLQLSGERAETILKKSSIYDVHENNFPIGKVVTTKFAKSQVIVTRVAANGFQLIVRRSFSDYIWQWIVDAGSRA